MLGSSPFTQEVDESMLPKGFKLSTMESYNGMTDPIDHLEMFFTSIDTPKRVYLFNLAPRNISC